MCYPALFAAMGASASTAATLATVGQVASIAMPIISGFQQAKAAKQEAAYNSRLKENEATRMANKGVDEENKHRAEVALFQQQQAAQFAAGNVLLGSGSPDQVLQSTADLGDTDARRIRDNYLLESDSMMDEAKGIRIAGKNAAKSAIMGGITSGLMAAGSVAGKWYSPDSMLSSVKPTGPVGISINNSYTSQFGRIV